MKIFDKIKAALEANMPFAVYNKGNQEKIYGFFQVDEHLHTVKDFKESGFVFAPFDDRQVSVVIPYAYAETYQEKLNVEEDFSFNSDFPSDDSSKESHVELIKKAIKAIENNNFKKVVLSRKEIVDQENVDVLQLFKKLLVAYPKAFVYVFFHPKVGLWLGATPETLIKITDGTFTTMSLAGTQVFKGDLDVVWEPKEIYEQQLVTDYVLAKLKPLCKTVKASKVETIKAGNLLHLKTEISGTFNNDVGAITTVLHPTPAVCGFPKQPSKEFILANENYDRSYYTGFLGELNLPNSELFVNLRCMEVIGNQISIYVGGGITKDSNPNKEWKETVVKAETMKRVL